MIAALNNGEIIRNLPETTYPQIISFDIKSLLNGDSDQNINLQMEHLTYLLYVTT